MGHTVSHSVGNGIPRLHRAIDHRCIVRGIAVIRIALAADGVDGHAGGSGNAGKGVHLVSNHNDVGDNVLFSGVDLHLPAVLGQVGQKARSGLVVDPAGGLGGAALRTCKGQVGRSVKADLFGSGNALTGSVEVGIFKGTGGQRVGHLLGTGAQGEHSGRGAGAIIDGLILIAPAAAGAAKAVIVGNQQQIGKVGLTKLLDAVLAAVVVPVIVAVHLHCRKAIGQVVDAGIVYHVAGQGTVAHQRGVLSGHMVDQVHILGGNSHLHGRGCHIEQPVGAGISLCLRVIAQGHQQHFGKGCPAQRLLGVKLPVSVSCQNLMFHAVGDIGSRPTVCLHIGKQLAAALKQSGIGLHPHHRADDFGGLLPGQYIVRMKSAVAAAGKHPQAGHNVYRLGLDDLIAVGEPAAGRRSAQNQRAGQQQRGQSKRQKPFQVAHKISLLLGFLE